MKQFFLLSIVTLMSLGAFAQARPSTADYNKVMQPAIEIEMPFESKTVMTALVDKLEKRGYKGKENKGYMVFKGVNLAELGPEPYDLYFKAERKSRKEKDVSILTMLVSAGSEKFIAETDNPKLIENAKNFLNTHTESATAYDLELQIKEQESATQKAEKKMANLVEDGKDLVKKKERLEKEIEENTKKQAEQKAEVEKQNQIFSTLKAKRKQ